MTGPPPLFHRAPLRRQTSSLNVGSAPPMPVVTYQAPITLEVFRASDNDTERVEFRLDTGAGITQMGLPLAKRLGLKTTGPRGKIETTTAAGTRSEEIISGSITVRFPGSIDKYKWDCLFFVNREDEVPPLLGLRGVFQSVRLSFDRSYGLYGCFVFEG